MAMVHPKVVLSIACCLTFLLLMPNLGNAQTLLSEQCAPMQQIVITRDIAATYSLFANTPGFVGARIPAPNQGAKYRTLEVTSLVDGVQAMESYVISKDMIEVIRRHAIRNEENTPAASDTIWCEVELHDGSNIYGRFLRWTGLTVDAETDLGVLRFPVERIVHCRFLDITSGEVGVNALRRDPNPTRLLFAPTARNLKKGEGYFSVYEVLMPSIQYGFGSNITLGGGFSPIMSSDFAMFWLTPKVGIVERDDWAVAAGILSINLLSTDESSAVGIGYGVGTFGSPDKSVTVGLGYGYSYSDTTEYSSDPFFMLGGELRIGRNTKLITENWLPPGFDSPMLSIGVRWFARRISADFALVRQADMEIFAIPWIDFIVNF